MFWLRFSDLHLQFLSLFGGAGNGLPEANLYRFCKHHILSGLQIFVCEIFGEELEKIFFRLEKIIFWSEKIFFWLEKSEYCSEKILFCPEKRNILREKDQTLSEKVKPLSEKGDSHSEKCNPHKERDLGRLGIEVSKINHFINCAIHPPKGTLYVQSQFFRFKKQKLQQGLHPLF